MNRYGIEAEDNYLDSEAFDIIGEDLYGEDLYGEDLEAVPAQYSAQARARMAAKRKARARAMARRRRLRQYLPPPSGRLPGTLRQGFTRVGQDIQQTQAAVEDVDLSNKVQFDMVTRLLANHQIQLNGTAYSQVVSRVIDQLKAEFPDFTSNEIIQVILNAGPLLLLRGEAKGKDGLASFLTPGVVGAIAAAAIALIGRFTSKGREPEEVTVTPQAISLPSGGTASLTASARDLNGKIIGDVEFTWQSSNEKSVKVDPSTGFITAIAHEDVPTVITATEKETKVLGAATVVVPPNPQS
jgi:hypothetical protein